MNRHAGRVLAVWRRWTDLLPAWAELRRPRHFVMPLACLVVCLVITLLLASRVASDAARVEREQFQRHGERVAAEVARRVTLPIYGLRGAAGAYAATRRLDHAAFRDYVESRDLPTEFPGVRGMGFIDRVPRERLPEYTAEASRDRGSPFAVRSQGNAPELFPIRYIEPLAPNWQAVGFDLGSEAIRRETIERAVSSGLPAITGPITLVQDASRGAGALLLLPTFRYGTDHDTPERRRHALFGLFYAAIVFEELFVGVGRSGDGQVALRLTDDHAPAERKVVFDDKGSAAADRDAPPRHLLTQPLHLWGRDFSLTLSSTPQFEALRVSNAAPFVLIGGITFSLQISAMLWLLIAARSDAEARATRKTAEQQCTQALLQAVVDNLPCGLSVFDAQRRLRLHNAGLAGLLVLPEELFNRPGVRIDDLTRFIAEHGEHPGITVQAAGERVVEYFDNRQPHSFERQGLDGRWLEIQATPLADGGLLRIYTDITTHKQADQKLRDANQALGLALRKAEEAAVAKNIFLANMSHEIRTPMNAILGMTALVIDGELDNDQRELLEIVRNSADALLALINDILDFSKIEAGQMTVESVEFDLHDCAAGAALLLRERALDKGLALECVIAPDVPRRVRGDPNRLRQVLVNLLSNAIKFTERGWVILSLASAPEAAGVMFEVSDSGIGIAADKVEHVFQAFTQADESVTRRYGGTGLGLSISRDLVAGMGGQLAVASVEGEGSQFHFSLALVAVAPGAVPGLPGIDPLVVVLDRAPTEDAALLGSLRHWQLRPAVTRSVEQLLEAAQAPATGTRLYLVKASWLPQADASQRARLWAAMPRAQRILLRDREVGDAVVRQFDHRLDWPRPPHHLLDLLGHALRGVAPDAEAGGREPRRVLLVDDNPINRKLAVRLLESMGHSVATAEHGQRALEALEREPFDLVLMDLQMPVLGGLEATALLRRSEAGGSRRTPVVAMTAHALDEDRQRCLDAGMDGHLAKPISRQALHQAVAEHALDGGEELDDDEAADAGPATATPTPAEAPAAATPALDRAAALAPLGGDGALLDELVGMFVDDLPASRAELASAAPGEPLSRCAHDLSGALTAIGASAAGATAAALESAARSEAPAAAQVLRERLLSELETLAAALPAAATGAMANG